MLKSFYTKEQIKDNEIIKQIDKYINEIIENLFFIEKTSFIINNLKNWNFEKIGKKDCFYIITGNGGDMADFVFNLIQLELCKALELKNKSEV